MGIIWHIFCSFLHVHIPGKHEIPFDDRLRACRGFVFVAAACLVSDMGRRQDIRIQSRIQTLFNSILRIGSLVPVRLRVWLYRRTDALRSQACRFGVRNIADLVSGTHEEMDGLTPILQKLSAKDGVFSVMGNHDYAPYIEMDDSLREKEISVLQERVRGELAWVLLLNQNRVIKRGNDSIAIAGVENQSYSFTRHLQYGDLKKALKGVDGVFTVLLSHDPTHWRAEILPETGVPLTLSGHTHAAQIKIFGFTPASWVFKETDGLYEEDGRYLYVNIGLGGVVPFRLGATPEITVIDLHCKR